MIEDNFIDRPAIECRTVGELLATLSTLPPDAPVATLYDWGADVKRGVTVHGAHTCDADCDQYDCSLAGCVVLDIDPRPAHISK